MHLIHLPYKKEIRALKHKLADFLTIDKSKIKFRMHTSTNPVNTLPVYPQVASNVGYLTIKPLKKNKYQLVYEFLYKTLVHSVSITPLPRQQYVIPLYSITSTGTLPSIQYDIVPKSTLFFQIVDFCHKQNKTVFDLLHKLKMRNVIYYPTQANMPALLKITTDLSGIPTLAASGLIDNDAEDIAIYTQNKKLNTQCDYPKLANKLSKKIKKITENFTITLSKNDESYNNIRITVHSLKDANCVKKLLKHKKCSISNTNSDQYVIKMNVKYLNNSYDCDKSSESDSSSECSRSSSSDESYPSTWSSYSDSSSSSSNSSSSSSKSSSSSSKSKKHHRKHH